MKKLLLSMALGVCFGAISQTTLLFENFETGGTNFTMNTTGLGGMSGLSGDNAWVINNNYAGGSGTSSCFGFGFSLGATSAQPAGITNGPNSNYMHILSDDGTSNGILNANYSAADGSFCFFAQSHFTQMNTDVSTVGMSSVELDFWWMCLGDVNAFGQVYYSTNMGTTWTQITAPMSNYFNVGGWTQQVLTDAAWDNQPTLRFAYRFVNNVATGGGDPSFSIDDVTIRATAGGAAAISTTNDVTPASWCTGTPVSGTVNFVSTGTYNAGNVYSAELSDASGVFASPTVVGTLASSASGSLSITTAIPGVIPAGTGYRIRVVASDPVTTGTNNGSDLVINPLPTVTLGTFANMCINHSASTLTGGSPVGGTYSGTGVSAGMFDPAVAGVGSHTITYTYTDANSCVNSANQTIGVDACASITELESATVTVYPNPADATFSISTDGIISHVALLDMSGRIVKSFSANSEAYDVNDINAGVYLLQINNNAAIQTIRLVIK